MVRKSLLAPLLALLLTPLYAVPASAVPTSAVPADAVAAGGVGVAAPPAPSNLRNGGTTGTSVSLVWTPPPGGRPDGYEITRDGVVTGTATIPSAMAVGLQPATTYSFQVRTRDGDELSAPSNTLRVTTGADPGGSGGRVIYAGARSSNYGIRPFPSPCGWSKALNSINGQFTGSTPAAVWIVGTISGNGVNLEFPRPNDGVNYGSRIRFASSDKHERFLDYFDSRGIKVWLQVESGFASMPTLIDLVMKRYRHHPSVLGFGVDVEWFNPRGADLNDPVTDALAQQWETRLKGYGQRYTLFLKHFDQSSMPPTYRGDIVFVDDSQELGTVETFVAEMKAWADRYHPNTVLYQIGYASDRPWWSRQPRPYPQTLGTKLAGVTRQDFGIAWVDFTLREVAPTTC